ncbi:MAG: hypothetical protein GEU98_17350 [Pseudonocardiaceae bacterium]|nr:hypothetical protein [Pseudonocardiaceae bacterium]
MAAQLGSTTDPKALVPGVPDAIQDVASALRRHAKGVEDSGTDVGKVDVGGWAGLSSDAFRDKVAVHPPKWFKIADALSAAAQNVDAFADTLRWAQSQAREAIELWEQGKARSAAEAVSATVTAQPDQANADPGAGLRQQAEQLLERARTQLREAGDEATGALGGTQPTGTGAPPKTLGPIQDFFDELGSGGAPPVGTGEPPGTTGPLVDLAGKLYGDFDTWSQGPHVQHDWTGPSGNILDEDGLSLGHGRAGAYLARGGFNEHGSIFGIDVNGKGEYGVGAEGHYSGHVGPTGADVEAGARVGAWGSVERSFEAGPASLRGGAEGFVGAEANAHYKAGPDGVSAGADYFHGARVGADVAGDIGPVGGQAHGEASAGAEANANASLDKNGAHAGAGAFAGAKASGDIGGDIGGIGVNASGEASVGAGAHAGVDFGRDPETGAITLGADAGAAAGVGGGGGLEVTVDPNKVANTAQDGGRAIGDAVDKVTPW